MESRRANLQAQDAELHTGPKQDGAYDVGCIDPNQERGGPNTHIPTKL